MKELSDQYAADDIKKARRNIRRDIEIFNQAYFNGESNAMIVYSSNGYKLTSDSADITKCMNEHMTRAIAHFRKYHKIAKVRGEKLNFTLDELLED